MEYTVKVDKEGTVRYYKPGTDVLHREDGPAVVCYDGTKKWFKEGKLHREDGPAVLWSYGCEEWYKEGKLHREDGPATKFLGGKEFWYINDKLHREDGPAVVYPDGRQQWCIDGKQISRKEFDDRTKEATVRTFTVPAGTKEIRIQFE
jgi:hypothetical protein